MPEQFRSLASMLRQTAAQEIVEEHLAPPNSFEVLEVSAIPESDELIDEQRTVLRDVRIFHARIAEAVEEAVETLVQDIAAQVLGRELELTRANIAAITERALERFAAEEPLRVRAHPNEVEHLDCVVPVVADDALRLGDVVVELRTGTVDATLGARLDAVMRSAA